MYEIALSVHACLRSNTRADIAWLISPRGVSLVTDAVMLTPGGGRIGTLLGKTFDEATISLADPQVVELFNRGVSVVVEGKKSSHFNFCTSNKVSNCRKWCDCRGFIGFCPRAGLGGAD